MASPKRNKTQRLADAALVEHYALMKYPVRKIADLLNERGLPYTISWAQVQYDIEKMRTLWQAEAMRDISKIKADELRGLAKQEEECWVEWHKSKQNKERTLAEKTDGQGTGNGQKSKVSKVVEGQCGDASYMRLILEIRDRRAKILGLDAPARQEFSGPGGGPIVLQAATMSDEELDRLITEQGRIKALKDAPINDTQGSPD